MAKAKMVGRGDCGIERKFPPVGEGVTQPRSEGRFRSSVAVRAHVVLEIQLKTARQTELDLLSKIVRRPARTVEIALRNHAREKLERRKHIELCRAGSAAALRPLGLTGTARLFKLLARLAPFYQHFALHRFLRTERTAIQRQQTEQQ